MYYNTNVIISFIIKNISKKALNKPINHVQTKSQQQTAAKIAQKHFFLLKSYLSVMTVKSILRLYIFYYYPITYRLSKRI